MRISTSWRLAAALLAVALSTAACESGDENVGAPAKSTPTASQTTASDPRATSLRFEHVVVLSVDGLSPEALQRLGETGAPHFWRLAAEGASTFDARTAVERTNTLPNHTSMMTGRRVNRDRGGHRVALSNDPAGTVSRLAGGRVHSVFDVLEQSGHSSALFAGKSKFAFLDRSWPSIDRFTIAEGDGVVARLAIEDGLQERRALTFIHLASPDATGHAQGWLSPAYMDVVRQTDDLLGRLLRAIDSRPWLARRLVLVVTADHGGTGSLHGDETEADNFTVPSSSAGAASRPEPTFTGSIPTARIPKTASCRTGRRGSRSGTGTWQTW